MLTIGQRVTITMLNLLIILYTHNGVPFHIRHRTYRYHFELYFA
jgi:hypothetical protein